VLENVCLPALLTGKTYEGVQAKAIELLEWLDLKARLSHLPGQLSGGEMQRTAIARALINEPAIVLADEPTGNLDSRNGQMVIELLVELNRRWNRTVFIATHSTLADRVATMKIDLKDGAVTDQTWTGLLFILMSYPFSKLPGPSGFPLPGYMAIFLIVSGFSLLAPLSLQYLGQSIAPYLRRFAGEPAFLATRYVRDSGTRTAISVGALITAVALFGALVIMIHSFRQTVELWVNQSITGDLFLYPKMGDLNQYRDPCRRMSSQPLKI